jgi:hypothetical protein
MSAVQWGSVSTWVAGVGTVAAVSLALWEARGERKERLRRELRQQAERISAWFVGMHKDPDGEDPDDGNPDGEDAHRDAWLPPELRGRAADVELLNNSEDPVTDVLVFLSRVSYKGASHRIRARARRGQPGQGRRTPSPGHGGQRTIKTTAKLT